MSIREDFPILEQKINDYPLVYLDSAASSLRPRQVIEAMAAYEAQDHSNIHRSSHTLSQRACERYEQSRENLRRWLGAGHAHEIIFTRGATEAINLVAWGWGLRHLRRGDRILLTALEHHANIIPWQIIAQRTGAELHYIPLDPNNCILDLSQLDELLNAETCIVSMSHISNVFGTIQPIEAVIRRAREVGAIVMIDGAQSTPHLPIDVQALDCDFFACSAHKMCGPTGIGLLYGKTELLQDMDPIFGGGGMISSVDWHSSTWADLPHRFEAGTAAIAAAIGWSAAVDYLRNIGLDQIAQREAELVDYTLARLHEIDNIEIYAHHIPRIGVISFNLPDIHAYDLGQLLDLNGVAIRTGHHCAQLLMRSLQISGTARVSLYLYNTKSDIDALIDAIKFAQDLLTKPRSFKCTAL